MLSTLILDNFKSFGRRQWIPFAPITLIFGANSSGKSSILQSLLLLQQTLLEAEPEEFLRLKGNVVDLASFPDLVFGHDLSRTCEIAPLLAWPGTLTPETGRLASHQTTIPLLDPYMPGPTDDIGAGFRFASSQQRVGIEMKQVAYYWKDLYQPLFELDVLPGWSEAEPVPGQGHRAFLGSISEDHLVWAQLYEQFMENKLADVHEAFTAVLEAVNYTDSPELAVQALLKTPEYEDEAQRAQANNLVRTYFDQIRGRQRRWADYTTTMFYGDIKDANTRIPVELKSFLPIAAGAPPLAVSSTLQALDVFLAGTLRIDSGLLQDALRGRAPRLIETAVRLGDCLRRELQNLIYVGPFRGFPLRHSIAADISARYIGKWGEHFTDVLVSDRGGTSREQRVDRQLVLDYVNEVLAQNEIGYTLLPTRVQLPQLPGQDLYYLTLRDEATRTVVTFADVGFGMSQMLPLVVQALATRNRLILVEQPELHIHPRLQTNLGQILALSALDRGHQIILETHSEHIILRLQKLIRRGELPVSAVSVIYVWKDEEGSHCTPMPIRPDGSFERNWPDGFFEERYQEVFA